MTTDKTSTAPVSVIEHIAQQWDGCTYESAGEDIDIGNAIRAAARNFAPSPDVVGGDVERALQWLHVLVTSSHNHDWKRNREEWAVIRKALAAQRKGDVGAHAAPGKHVAFAIVDPEDLEIEQLSTSSDELEKWRVEGTEIVPLTFASHPAEQTRGEPVAHFIETTPGNWEQAASMYASQPGVVPLYRAPRQAVPDGWVVETGPLVLGQPSMKLTGPDGECELYGIFQGERFVRDFLMAAFPAHAAPSPGRMGVGGG